MKDIKSVFKKANTIKESRTKDKEKEDEKDKPTKGSVKKLFWRKDKE